MGEEFQEGGWGDPARRQPTKVLGGFEGTRVGWVDFTSELIINRSKTWS
jgi:hypothetical protein